MSFTSVKAQRFATDAVASATAAAAATATVGGATTTTTESVGSTASANLTPAVPSGFARRRNTIVGGLLGLAVLYHLVYNFVKGMVRVKRVSALSVFLSIDLQPSHSWLLFCVRSGCHHHLLFLRILFRFLLK